jgi:hypothetical protein
LLPTSPIDATGGEDGNDPVTAARGGDFVSGRPMPLKRNRTRRDDALARVDPTRFEALIAEHYRTQGWSVEHVGADHAGTDHDGGIDLKLRRADEYLVVQCKRWNANQVTHNAVHELIGVMITQGATGAVVVTCGEFTRAALDAALREPRMQLVDGDTVRRWIDLGGLEAEAARSASAHSHAADDWARPTTRNRDARARHRKGGGAFAPAIIATAVVMAFVGFVVLQAQPAARATATPSSPATYRAPLAPASLPPPSTAPVAPVPERAGHLKPLADTVKKATTAYLRQAGMPDTSRPIDREAARAAARKLDGVRSVFWIDRDNFMVMVDGSERRSMAMIDQVCIALQPLGDTLAVVVNVQDLTAQTPDAATTLSRNCQLPKGQRAFLQGKRQVDVVAPETRAVFKDQQGEK